MEYSAGRAGKVNLDVCVILSFSVVVKRAPMTLNITISAQRTMRIYVAAT